MANSISGNAGVALATVSYSGAASGSVTADATGNFTIPGLGNGSYTITPSLAGYTFSPVNSNQTISGVDITGVGFIATLSGPYVDPPYLIQAKTLSVSNNTSGTITITYQAGDTVVFMTGTGGTGITSVNDSGGSTFTEISSGGTIYWKLYYCLSANASTSITMHTAASTNMTAIVAVYRGCTAIGSNTGLLQGSSSTIIASLPIATGSKLVGMLGVAFNGTGNVTLAGDGAGKTIHGDLRTQIGDGHTGLALIGLVDSDGNITSASAPSLQVTASLSSNWLAIALELKGTSVGTKVYQDFWIMGDSIDSDGVVRSAVTFGTPPLTISARKGAFPCIPQFGGTPVVQTYATGFITTRFSFQYGTIEARAKLGGVNFHNIPIFMLDRQSKPWPNWAWLASEFELDAGESGVNIGTNQTSYRCFANPPSHILDITPGWDPTADFHVYKIVWKAASVTWFTDGVQVDQITTNIPTNPMYICVGGYLGEYAINDSLLPTSLQLQYLKVTDGNGAPVSNTGNVDILSSSITSSMTFHRRRGGGDM